MRDYDVLPVTHSHYKRVTISDRIHYADFILVYSLYWSNGYRPELCTYISSNVRSWTSIVYEPWLSAAQGYPMIENNYCKSAHTNKVRHYPPIWDFHFKTGNILYKRVVSSLNGRCHNSVIAQANDLWSTIYACAIIPVFTMSYISNKLGKVYILRIWLCIMHTKFQCNQPKRFSKYGVRSLIDSLIFYMSYSPL